MWDELGDGGIRVLTARKDGQRIAMVLLLCDHRSMYDHASCSLPEFNRLGPNNLLHWEGILEAKRMGLRTYDFISASGAAGKFKKSFGPRKVVTSTSWNRSRTGAEKVLKQAYERFLRWRRAATR
jgi:CelD/BcsL family acetyltransferase involved in cellulose biosynthesis